MPVTVAGATLMAIVGKFLKVQWRMSYRWPGFGFGGTRAPNEEPPEARPPRLSFAHWQQVLDEVAALAERFPDGGRMHFSVGRADRAPRSFLPFLDEVHRRGLAIRLSGRPGFVTERTVAELARLDVSLFHMLIGPGEANRRRPNLGAELAAALRAIRLLDAEGIRYRFRLIVDPSSLEHLDRVLHFVEQHEVAHFDLLRAVPYGRFVGESERWLGPDEFRQLLTEVRRTFGRWRRQGRRMRLVGHRAEHLWWLWEAERRPDWREWVEPGTIHSCSVGRNMLALRPDGTVWPCQRLPLVIGKVPEQSVEEVLLRSEGLKALRGERPSCEGCEVLDQCRGCMALAYATSGDPLGPDPQCWWPGPGESTPTE